jgi:hypothetical protein
MSNRKLTAWDLVLSTVLLIAVAVSYAAQEKSQPSTTAETASNKYSSEKYGIAFIIPEKIKLYTIDNPGPLTSMISSKTPFILVNPDFKEENINVKVSEDISESDLTEFKKMLEKNPNMPLPEYQRVSVKFIKIGSNGNKKAVEHVFIMQGNILGKLRQVTFVHKGRGFIFTCATAVDRFDKANKRFFEPLFSGMEFQ